MDNTTPQPNTQDQMSHEDVRAGLGFSNMLLEQMLPKDQPVEASQNPQNDATTQAEPKPEEAPQEDKSAEIEDRMAEMEKRIMDGLKREVDGIRGEISDAIDNG